MRIIAIDYETFFSADYTLSKSTTEAYCRDDRFETHGAAIKWGSDQPARWYDERDLRLILQKEDWSDTAIICHHAHFDAFILGFHYSVKPKCWLDTLAMARLLLGNHISVSLDSVRSVFGLPAKRTPYEQFKGKHWHEMSPDVQRLVADGCCDEVESIWTLFGRLAQSFPSSQYAVVDILTRMFVEPRLQGDLEFFGRVWTAEHDRKSTLLSDLGLTEADLQSSETFASILRAQGVEPGMKDGKNGEIYAFAKTDPFMQELLDSDDDVLVSLAQARLGVKSTIQQTRAETLGWMTRRGPLCVYVRPYGARTTRPSGGDKSNFLNLKKHDPDLPRLDDNVSLKQGICAPEGYLLASVDSSQQECRLLNYVAGQQDVIDTFRAGKNPYTRVGQEFYGYPIEKATHPTEYQLGKVVELQAGYMSGGDKIRATLRNKAGIVLTPEQGIDARDAYRATHPQVVKLWADAGRMLARLAGGPPTTWGPVDLRDGRMYLPNGAAIIYDTLEYHTPEDGEGHWRIKTRRGWEKMYSGRLVENLIQALAWNLVSDAMVRIAKSFRVLSTTYDDLLIAIPRDGHERDALAWCKSEMTRPPAWAPDIPLDAGTTIGERYE